MIKDLKKFNNKDFIINLVNCYNKINNIKNDLINLYDDELIKELRNYNKYIYDEFGFKEENKNRILFDCSDYKYIILLLIKIDRYSYSIIKEIFKEEIIDNYNYDCIRYSIKYINKYIDNFDRIYLMYKNVVK